MTSYHKGDTIRLKGTFYTFAGVLSDLSAPTLKLYLDPDETTPVLTKTGTELQHPSTGIYYYDYTTTTLGHYIYEIGGTAEGSAVLDRGEFYVVFYD